jgi:hypothetical protein
LHVSLPGRATPRTTIGHCPYTPVNPRLASFRTISSVSRLRRGEIGFVLHHCPPAPKMASGNHPRDATAKYAKYAKGSIGPSLVVFRVVRVFRGHVLLFSAPSVVHSEGLDEVSFAPTSRRGRRRGQPRLFYRRLPRPVCCVKTKNTAEIAKADWRRQAVGRRPGRRRQAGNCELTTDNGRLGPDRRGRRGMQRESSMINRRRTKR